VVVRTYVRVTLAAIIAAVGMGFGALVAGTAVGRATDLTSSLVIVAASLTMGAAGYLLGVRVFRITEVSEVLRLVSSRR
jgi:hypothetical protein